MKKRSQALKRYRRSVYSFFPCFFVSTLIRNCQYFRADRILDRPPLLFPPPLSPHSCENRSLYLYVVAQQLYCLSISWILALSAKFVGIVRRIDSRQERRRICLFHRSNGRDSRCFEEISGSNCNLTNRSRRFTGVD